MEEMKSSMQFLLIKNTHTNEEYRQPRIGKSFGVRETPKI